MIDPTLILFDSHLEAAVVLLGFFVYIVTLAVNGYRQAETKEEKKDVLAFLAVFSALSAASLAIIVYFSFFASA